MQQMRIDQLPGMHAMLLFRCTQCLLAMPYLVCYCNQVCGIYLSGLKRARHDMYMSAMQKCTYGALIISKVYLASKLLLLLLLLLMLPLLLLLLLLLKMLLLALHACQGHLNTAQETVMSLAAPADWCSPKAEVHQTFACLQSCCMKGFAA